MSENRLLRSVQRLSNALGKFERVTAAEHGVSVSQLRCLLYLEAAGADGARVSDVAADQGLAVSTMTRNLALLERKGWLARESDPRDRRIVRVRLTSTGQQVSRHLGRATQNRFAMAFRSFHPTDRVERAVALDRVATALERV